MAGIDNLLEVMGFPADADIVEKDNCAGAAAATIKDLLTALGRISNYQDVEEMRECSEDDWGCPFEDAIEMSYENVIGEAKCAIRDFVNKRPENNDG